MKAVVKVSHLRTDDALYCRGDIVDYPEERIIQFGSSVKRIDSESVMEADDNIAPAEPEVVPDVDKEEYAKSKTTKRGRKKA